MKSAGLLSCGVLLAAALGCSNNGQPTQSAAAPPATPAASAPVPSPAPAAASGIVPAPRRDTPAPIAASDGPFDGIRAEVTELKRGSGGTLSLKFSIVNDSGRTLGHSEVGLGSGGLMMTPYAIDGVHLIDLVGKKKYFVAKDSGGACVCSQFGFVEGGTRANHWAKFSAPPDDVERLSVVIPSFAPMDDVPVSR